MRSETWATVTGLFNASTSLGTHPKAMILVIAQKYLPSYYFLFNSTL